MRFQLTSVVVLIVVLVTASPIYSQSTKSPEKLIADTCLCIESILDIRATAVETIFLQPEEVIQDVKRFWREDETYQWVKSWHEYNNIPVDYDDWKETMKIIAGYPLEKRQKSKALQMVNKLKKMNEKFTRQAIPHICSFLPVTKEMLNTIVRFATYTYPRAFCVGDNIVQDVMNDYYDGDADHIMNSILHEVFHVGFGRNHLHRKGIWIEPRSLYEIVQNLQNEGMATYCTYKACSIFPVEYDKDYAMLEDPSEVKKALKSINSLFKEALSLTPEELHSRAFDVGVDQRAYYIAGGFMAQTIDTVLGRDRLAKTVLDGPRSFINTYNFLVDQSLQVTGFDPPVQLSPLQDLRQKALQEDDEGFLKILSELSPKEIGATDFGEHILYNTGHMLRSNDKSKLAIKLFKFCIQSYPGKDYQYKWLAQALSDNGQTEEAIEAYHTVLAADPYDVNAKEALANLEKRQ